MWATAFNAFAPPGTLPVYPAAPHCNTKGLTDLGEYTVRRMIDKKMIIDPDHMSVIARKQTMALIEAQRYSGVCLEPLVEHPGRDPADLQAGRRS